jgi:membrane associated rhomboid family serine protease
MFVIPIKRDFPIRHKAWVVYCLILANSLIFLATWSPHGLKEVVHRFGFTPMNHEPWTVVTAMFLHGGWFHILGNMLFLWMFGESVEDAIGHALTLICYLVCGVFGTLLHYLFNAHSTIPCIGASGAISGLVGMYVVLFPKAKMDLELYVLRFHVGTLPTNALAAGAAWLGEQSLLGVFARVTGWSFGVAFMAHVGGLLAGALLGFALIHLRIGPAYRDMIARKTMRQMTCPGSHATMPRRRAGRYRCSSLRTPLRMDEEGNLAVREPSRTKAPSKKRDMPAAAKGNAKRLPRLGAIGFVLESLCPLGYAVVDGMVYPSRTQGEELDADKCLVVIGHDEDRLVVRAATDTETRHGGKTGHRT